MNRVWQFLHRVGTGRWFSGGRRLRFTGAGLGYLAVWLGLLFTGLQQQRNLIMLTAGMAAGPLAASFIMSAGMLRKVKAARRLPDQVFAGDPLSIEYSLENGRKATSAIAVQVDDELIPADTSITGARKMTPSVLFERVAPRQRGRLRWQGPAPVRGKYRFSEIDLVTRGPFGLLERRETVLLPESLVVYPAIGRLTRQWHRLQREAAQTRRGRRHDRTAQQQEYHGLRDFRSGDSPRWIHWRTSARVGELMVKEYEQENDQEIVVLLDPWVPRGKVSETQRATLELALQFAATVCLDTCRQPGRRIVLGWAGKTPGVRQGLGSIRMLHELLETLALIRGSSEGEFAQLFDVISPAVLRAGLVVLVSTRPTNVLEEAGRSARLAEVSVRGLLTRFVVLDVSHGDLEPYFEFENQVATTTRDRPSFSALAFPRPQAQASASSNGNPI
jgi:uncharacterized protein (DUF58 family)